MMRLSLDVTLSQMGLVVHYGEIITVKHFVMTKGFGKDHGELPSLHGVQRSDFLGR
jgi:hypothetical protein